MSNPPKILKTCSNCGLEKPLSAFMQISGDEGTVYTNICSDCRQSMPDEVIDNTDLEGDTRVETRNTIDAKSKIVADKDKMNLKKEIDENYFDEREKNEERQIEKIEKKENYLKNEKEHRDTYIKKSSFLDSSKRAPLDSEKVYGSAAQRNEAERFNFNAPFEDTRTPQLKHSGVIYQQFKSWLGKSAPVVSGNPAATKEPPKERPLSKDDVTDYINNTWSNRPKR